MKASVGGEVDWPSWALSVRGLSSTQRHVLRVLCELCDERGTLVISSRHLADRLCVHRATLFRALAFLETQGLIRREKQRDHSGGLIPTRFQLLRRIPAHRDAIPTPTPSPASSAASPQPQFPCLLRPHHPSLYPLPFPPYLFLPHVFPQRLRLLCLVWFPLLLLGRLWWSGGIMRGCRC